MKLDIPKKPKDGHRVTFWRFNSNRDGLVHVRWTYVKNKPCWDVIDPEHKSNFYKNGAPFVDQWYIESRYVPSSSGAAAEWNGNGRTDHAHIDDFAKIDEDNHWLTFEEARLALFEFLCKQAMSMRHEADRLSRLGSTFFTMTEPA